MRRIWVAVLIVVMAIGAAAYLTFDQYKVRVAAIIDHIRDPIAAPRQIAWAQGPAEPPAGERPPNVIVILADDLGFNDITFNGGGFAGGLVPTPNIDAIGRQGASFDEGYAANATCSPSRAAIMTGRYPARFGFEYTAVPAALARNVAEFDRPGSPPSIYHADRERDVPPLPEMGMPASEITLAELLRTRGYHTMHIGKWHLGNAPGLRPEAQGFDESLGFMEGAGKYLSKKDRDVVNAPLDFDPLDGFFWQYLPFAVQWNGGQRFRPDRYITDYFTVQAERAINANRNRPFLLYLAYNAPHNPLQATREDYQALPGIKDRTARVYGAMLRALDRGVGHVLEALRKNGLDDNTIVIFTSDNGGAWYTGLSNINRPYRGWKATFFEGGIHVPLFLRWPGHIAAGQHLRGPASQIDIFATAAAAGGASLPTDRRIDGVDLLPFAQGRLRGAPHSALFWRSGQYRCVRDGDWKLQVSERPHRTWLFNLASDPHEHIDLSAMQPERVKELRAVLRSHDAEMPKPLWPALIELPVRIDVQESAPWRPNQPYVYWAN